MPTLKLVCYAPQSGHQQAPVGVITYLFLPCRARFAHDQDRAAIAREHEADDVGDQVTVLGPRP